MLAASARFRNSRADLHHQHADNARDRNRGEARNGEPRLRREYLFLADQLVRLLVRL